MEDLLLGSQWSIILGYRRLKRKKSQSRSGIQWTSLQFTFNPMETGLYECRHHRKEMACEPVFDFLHIFLGPYFLNFKTDRPIILDFGIACLLFLWESYLQVVFGFLKYNPVKLVQ